MTSQTKAFLTLVISAPILTEIVSGNTPAHALLNPRIELFLLVAYSLPLRFPWRSPRRQISAIIYRRITDL